MMCRFKIGYNVFGLCVRAGFGAQNCQPALNLNRSTKLQVCTSPRLTQNPCYQLAFCLSLLVCPLFAVSLCVGLVALLHFFVWLLRWQKMQMCYQKRWLYF